MRNRQKHKLARLQKNRREFEGAGPKWGRQMPARLGEGWEHKGTGQSEGGRRLQPLSRFGEDSVSDLVFVGIRTQSS